MAINCHRVFAHFQNLFEKEYGKSTNHGPLEEPNSVEFKIINKLLEIMKSLCDQSCDVTTDTTLDYDHDILYEEEEIENDSSSLHDSASTSLPHKKFKPSSEDYDYNCEFDTDCSLKKYPIDVMEKIVKCKDEKNLSFSAIQKMYPWLKHHKYISRFRTYLSHRGTFSDKVLEIEEYVSSRFYDARKKFLPVHDRDLRRWSIQKAREIDLLTFKASSHFIKNLKIRVGIVSRKVTSVVTKKYAAEESVKSEVREAYLNSVNDLIREYTLSNIINSDQSGFNYEFFSTRTLSTKGEKTTLQVVHNVSRTTHSYTIQPIITAAGKLLSPMFMCLQETTGNDFGPRVAANLYIPDNLIVQCSKSGKLTKTHVKIWVNECLKPHVTCKTLLLLDSWSGHDEEAVKTSLTDDQQRLQVKTIPPGTTGCCQPLDVYFFRQYKIFIKAIYDQLMLESVNYNNNRDFIINMHSLVHNQFTAKEFTPMLQYAWFKSGYSVSDPGDFKNVRQVCFDNKNNFSNCCRCENTVFISCAHCKKLLCLEHFLGKTCWH